MSLTSDRVLCSVVLFGLTLIVGTLPVYLFQQWVRRRQMRTVVITTSEHKQSILSANVYIQILTQIGGGILFFTVFVHMIPEIRQDFDEYVMSNSSIFAEHGHKVDDLPFPYLELAICGGFFAMHLAEVLMHSLLENQEASDSKEEIYDFDKKSEKSETTLDSEASGAHLAREEQPVLIAIRCHKSKCDIATHQHTLVKQEPLCARFFMGLMIISAFSVHSIFDGISIGVKDTPNELWTMFIAICSHKLLVAIIVSVELFDKCASMVLVVLHMTMFSLMAPLGIMVVIFTQRSAQDEDEVNPVTILLSAIASGTILYIVFLEIIQKERMTKLKPFTQFLALAFGFAMMFSVTLSLKEDHH